MTAAGQPTGAVFGFIKFLDKILKQEKPQYLGACFDVSRDTFRKQKFAEYKMQRPPTPDDLISQVPIIKEVLQAYGIPIYEKAGFEADDLIASLSNKAKLSGLDVVIVSPDKDMLQLVDEHTLVFNPYKNKGITYNTEKVHKELSIWPNQLIDFMSLAGDSADNIPSVRGVGEKTAVKLISEFGSIDGVIDNIDKIKPAKLQDTLRESQEIISLNRSIIKLRDDVKLEFDTEELKLKQPDYPQLYSLFQQLEFRSLLNNLPQEGKIPQATVKRVGQVSEFNNTQELVIVYEDQQLLLINAENKVLVVSTDKKLDSKIKHILSNPKIKKIGHNLKRLKVNLSQKKVGLQGLYFDTMVAAYLLNPSRAGYGLSDLVWDYLKQAFAAESIGPELAGELIFQLKEILEKEIKQEKLDTLFFEQEMPLVDVLADMELAGVAFNAEFLKSLSVEIEKQLIVLVEKIYELSGTQFNINSPKQLRTVLFEKLKLPVQKKTKSGPSTNEEVLQRLARQHPLPKILLEYRKLNKIKSTYVDALPLLISHDTGRIHACFNQTGTQTGRLSSSNPNLQNLPIRTDLGRQIRKAVVAPEQGSCLVSFDYSQIELRILAHLSKEPELIDAFNSNQDVHIATASLIYGLEQKDIDNEMRETAKRINFGIVYGLSSFGLSRDLKISQAEATNFIDSYFLKYSKVKDYIDEQITQARDRGYTTTITGRKRYIPEINSRNVGLRQFAQRQAINTPIQGSAADLIRKAMVDIHQYMRDKDFKSKLILQIHDELVFEVLESELDAIVELVRQKMEGCFKFCVPIRVDIKKGKNWLEMEPVARTGRRVS